MLHSAAFGKSTGQSGAQKAPSTLRSSTRPRHVMSGPQRILRCFHVSTQAVMGLFYMRAYDKRMCYFDTVIEVLQSASAIQIRLLYGNGNGNENRPLFHYKKKIPSLHPSHRKQAPPDGLLCAPRTETERHSVSHCIAAQNATRSTVSSTRCCLALNMRRQPSVAARSHAQKL